MVSNAWNIVIDMELEGDRWNLTLTASESTILIMLRNFYGMFETQVKHLTAVSSGKRPHGLVDEALVLLRCLVHNRLEVHEGTFVIIRQVKSLT